MNGDGIYFSLPYIDPVADQAVITPHYDAQTGQSFYPWETNIIPVEDSPAPSRETTVARSYEEPWYVDSINRAIERAAQVATIEVGGYPPYPNYPLPTPPPTPVPMPMPTPGVQPQPPGQGINLSNTTLMLIVGGFLLFTLGKRGR